MDSFLNDSGIDHVQKFRELLKRGDGAGNYLIKYEVLSGIRHSTDFKKGEEFFKSVPLYSFESPILFERATTHYRNLRKQGITIRKTVDVLIATQCILLGIPLLHHDRDFEPFEQLGLQTHQ